MGRRCRKSRRQQNRRILFGASTGPAVDATEIEVADNEIAPYSTDHILWYCRQNWSHWVRATQAELIQCQEELAVRPTSRDIAETVVNLEILYFRLIKV